MSPEPDSTRPTSARVARAAEHIFVGVGSGIAATVYGTIVVMATLTAAYATEKHPLKLALIVAGTALVLWIAHIYSHGLAESIDLKRHLNTSELLGLVWREIGILLAAAGPVLLLILGALGVFHEDAAVWLALAVGLIVLAAEGVRFARFENLKAMGTVAAIGANLALGLLVVALKVALAH